MWRARNPKSWWWTPDHDFLAAILYSLDVANWQRAGGKGPRPKPVKRPKETPRGVPSLEEFERQKQAFNDELERRRARKSG